MVPRFTPQRRSVAGAYEAYDRKPVHLTGTVVLDPNAGSPVNALALQNPMLLPMEVCEIKVSLLVLGASGVALNGASVGLQLALGQYAITNGYVPVWLFGPARNLGATSLGSTGNTLPMGGETVYDGTDSSYQFSWKLSHPLYVPAGTTIVPSFQHRGMVTVPITCRIGISARMLPAGYAPPKLVVPYVAAWNTCKTFDELGVADSDQSSELDLVNINDEDVHVDRFVGRINENNSSVALALYSYGEDPSADFGYRLLQIRMSDSAGNWVARDWTGFRTLFPAITRTWEMQPGVVLPAKNFYVAYANKQAPTITKANQISGQPQIGMVGWREVQP